MRYHCDKILAASILALLTLCLYLASPTTSTVIPRPRIHAVGTSFHSSMVVSLPHLRILPLGDSITFGYLSTTGDGYRAPLLDLLNVTFPSITYIGTQHTGNMTNNAHEGHPGYMIHDIARKSLPSLVEQPNVILLMAGTNDVARPYWPEEAPWRLSALVDFVLLNCPFSVIIVAQLAPITDPPDGGEKIKLFNSHIPDMVAVRQQTGKKVLSVNMSLKFTVEELIDGVHPNDKGYEIMAQTWHEGILLAVKYGWIWEPIAVGRKGKPTRTEGPDGFELPIRPIVEDGRICEICV